MRIKQPRRKKRKSPYKHHVRKHTRKGRPVRDYDRGRGNKPIKRRRLVKKPSSGGSFSSEITYTNSSFEQVTDLTSKNYIAALDEAILQRRELKPIWKIHLNKID